MPLRLTTAPITDTIVIQSISSTSFPVCERLGEHIDWVDVDCLRHADELIEGDALMAVELGGDCGPPHSDCLSDGLLGLPLVGGQTVQLLDGQLRKLQPAVFK